MLFPTLACLALAAEPTPTTDDRPSARLQGPLAGPGAAPLEGWEGQATLTGTLGGALRVDQSLGDHLFVHGSAALVPGEGVGFVGVGLRALRTPALNLAVTAGATALFAPDGYSMPGAFVGVAADAGTRDLRFDLHAPLVWDVEGGELAAARVVDLGSVGVRWLAGEHQVVRLGASPGRTATASWTWATERWHAGVGAGVYGMSPLAHLSVGATW